MKSTRGEQSKSLRKFDQELLKRVSIKSLDRLTKLEDI